MCPLLLFESRVAATSKARGGVELTMRIAWSNRAMSEPRPDHLTPSRLSRDQRVARSLLTLYIIFFPQTSYSRVTTRHAEAKAWEIYRVGLITRSIHASRYKKKLKFRERIHGQIELLLENQKKIESCILSNLPYQSIWHCVDSDCSYEI